MSADDQQEIAAAAYDVAAVLPPTTLVMLSQWVAASPDLASAKTRVSEFAHPLYRRRVTDFLARCARAVPPTSVGAASLALVTAAHAVQAHRTEQSAELVWTGPDADAVPLRRTEQAILEVIEAARQRLLLVCYAVYRIPRVREAVVRAASRGVRITVLAETPDRIVGAGEYDTLRALGDEVARCSEIFYWPREKRTQHLSGKVGILHVKCLVTDGDKAFLSSANLTEYAFSTNMEMGVLITGRGLPAQIESHFDALLAAGIFDRI